MPMRYAPFLQENGTIGFVAPSFGCVTEPYRSLFDNAQKQLAARGYALCLGPNCYESRGVGKSNTPQACGAEINDGFLRKDTDVIISVGGGFTMCEDLPYIDFDAIRKAPPKWYMGFSDNTNLTMTLPTLCDTAAIYGPHATAFGTRVWPAHVQDALGCLSGQRVFHSYDGWSKHEEGEEDLRESDPLASYPINTPLQMRLACVTAPTTFSGRLLGGCLDILNILVGTRFDQVAAFQKKYAADGIVWFLEACDLTPFGVRTALWRLKEAGWFHTAKGFIIGRPERYDAVDMELTQQEAVLSMLSEIGVPIVLDADLGHLPPAMPLVSGAKAAIRYEDEKNLTIQYDYS